jgi:hypothetical protein
MVCQPGVSLSMPPKRLRGLGSRTIGAASPHPDAENTQEQEDETGAEEVEVASGEKPARREQPDKRRIENEEQPRAEETGRDGAGRAERRQRRAPFLYGWTVTRDSRSFVNCDSQTGCAGHAGAVTRFPSVTA